MVNKRVVPEPRVHRNGLVVTEHIIRVVRDDGTIGQHIAGYVRNAFGKRTMIVAKDDDVARRQRSYQPRSEDVAPWTRWEHTPGKTTGGKAYIQEETNRHTAPSFFADGSCDLLLKLFVLLQMFSGDGYVCAQAVDGYANGPCNFRAGNAPR